MSTITKEQQAAIAAFIADRHIPSGLGTAENACSIACINLALSGRLTDDIPECMSEVVGNWIIRIQDLMPNAMRNSPEWRALLPHAAGTGRSKEIERLAILKEWLFVTVLPTLQGVADSNGFGKEWSEMCSDKTTIAADAADAAARAVARAARAVARAAADAADAAARAAARAADAATYATDAADAAARAAANVANVARAAANVARAAANVANVATYATDVAYAANVATYAANAANVAWQSFDVCGVLQKLIEVTE
jgi:hypothetical protein